MKFKAEVYLEVPDEQAHLMQQFQNIILDRVVGTAYTVSRVSVFKDPEQETEKEA